MIEIAELKTFEAVARLGGMGRAAEELCCVQSAVTARIRALEQRLGVALFTRLPRGVALTAAGHRLVPYARQILQLALEAERAARDDGAPEGPLLIGSLETTAAIRLAPVLTRFTAAHPRVDLTLRTGTTAELLAQVRDAALEGAFVCGPISEAGLEVEIFFREELVLLTAPGVLSIEAAFTDDRDLRIVVLRSGCSYRQRLESFLVRRGVPTPRMLEFGTLEAIVSCVAAGLGITLLPRALLGPVIDGGRVGVHVLPPSIGQVETLFVRRAGAFESSAMRAFLGIARGAVEREGAAAAA